jgi:exosortase
MNDVRRQIPEQSPQAEDEPRERFFTPLTAVVALLLVICFAPYLAWMWEIWMRSDYYGHGPLIPLIAAYLVYARRKDLAQAARGFSFWGIPLVLLGLALYALTVYRNVNFPQGFAMILVLGGLVLLLWGRDVGRLLLFPVTYLVFMVPVDRLLVTKLSLPLQTHAAAIAATVVSFVGMPVHLQGTTIVIPDYTFEVAQACSGLKSSIAMTALAALFAYLVAAPLWKRIVLFLSGPPVALAANAVRITLTLILGRAFGQAAAEGFFHTLSGLLVFVLGLAGLFGVARLLRCDRMRDDIW